MTRAAMGPVASIWLGALVADWLGTVETWGAWRRVTLSSAGQLDSTSAYPSPSIEGGQLMYRSPCAGTGAIPSLGVHEVQVTDGK